MSTIVCVAVHILYLGSFRGFVFESSSVDLLNISLGTAIDTASPLTPVLADGCASALLALATHPPVLADARAAALLASVTLPAVLADARAAALLAFVTLPPVLADA